MGSKKLTGKLGGNSKHFSIQFEHLKSYYQKGISNRKYEDRFRGDSPVFEIES